MDLPPSNTSYKDVAYWNQRYLLEDDYDWFKGYGDFSHLTKECIDKNSRILMLGCGNSSLSEDMYEDGYCNLVNIDYSSVVIEKMMCRSDRAKKMDWLVMDAADLKFPDCSFDVVLEKGTLDAMLAGEISLWNITSKSTALIDTVLKEVSRVLRPGGKFISITFAQPHFRIPLYAKTHYGWDVKKFEFGDTFHYFFYVTTKGCELQPELINKYVRELDEDQHTIKWLEDDCCPHYLNSINIEDSIL